MEQRSAVINLMTLFICYVTAGPIDPHATAETQNLFNLLKKIASDSNHFLVGKQNPTRYGAYGGHAQYWQYPHDGVVGFQYHPDMAKNNLSDELCDPCLLTHDFPAVAGSELGYSLGNENMPTLDTLLRKAHERGALITMSWHQSNIVTGNPVHISEDNGDVHHSVKRILPGGDHHSQFLGRLDLIADWVKSLKDSKGQLIPVIFRPWHEANGGWFWWGLQNKAENSVDDIKQLFQITVTYLRDTKGVHNLLYAYSPDCGPGGLMDLYPGDEFVDLLGVDCYLNRGGHDSKFLLNSVEEIVQKAEATQKIPALTEVGMSPADYSAWPRFFNDDILSTLVHSAKGTHIAYMLTWQNQCGGNTCSVYDAYPGYSAAQNYMDFYNDDHTYFLSDLKQHYPAV